MPALHTLNLILWSVAAMLVPVGLALLAIGAAREERAEEVATTALLALATAAIGYLVCGFALQFGGVAFVSGMPGLQSLTAEWSPLDIAWGPGWGVVGLRGFLLSAEVYNTDVYLLFISHLAAVTTAVLIALLALCQHVKRIYLLVIGLLISGLIYPLVGNWVWGGGWLANLGLNLQLGHGFVEVAGAGTIFLLGAAVAGSVFLIIKPRRAPETGPAHLPPIHFPLLMVIGALLAVAGWPGLVLANPLIQEQVAAPLVVVNLLLGAASAALFVSLYTWFVTDKPDALAIGRGTVAGLVAVSAACAFVPAWAALLIGAASGLLFLVSLYVLENWLRLDDPSGTMATFALPAIWGILAVAIFADGHWGAGWNGVGIDEYLGMPGQGVSGLLLASGYQPAGNAQLYAQLTGLGAIIVAGLLLPWVIWKTALWIHALGRRVAAAPVAAPADASAIQEPAGESFAKELTPSEMLAEEQPPAKVLAGTPSQGEPAEEAVLPQASTTELPPPEAGGSAEA